MEQTHKQIMWMPKTIKLMASLLCNGLKEHLYSLTLYKIRDKL